MIAELTFKLSSLKAKELANRYEIEKRRLQIAEESAEMQARLESQRAALHQTEALWRLRKSSSSRTCTSRPASPAFYRRCRSKSDSRSCRARIWPAWRSLTRLKSELRIAETQAKDIAVGQKASIDTRNGVIEGRVIRIDPSVRRRHRHSRRRADGELPRGAPPDLSVDGTIEIERLTDVLYVGRPAYGQANQYDRLFKIDA